MRTIALMLFAALVTACASPTVQMSSAKSANVESAGMATLASFGTFEMELAPVITRLALARHNAAKALRAGRIDVATAEHIQALADVARVALKQSQAEMFNRQETPAARAKLNEAMVAIYQIELEIPQ